MPSAPTMVRATTVILICAGGLAACGVGPSTPSVAPEAPSITSVVNARFAVSVDLDHGGLSVTPPRAGAVPAVTEPVADAMFEAADAVEGPHAFAIFGLGLVTVAPSVEQPTTTTPPPNSTAPVTGTATTASSRRSLGAETPMRHRRPSVELLDDREAAPEATTTTTTLPTSSSTTVPSNTALPNYRRRLAWVGIVWGATESCPGTTTTQAPSLTTMSYVAIVIDAQTGHGVLAYRSGGTSPCSGSPQAPAVTAPDELVSVAWQPVGPASTAVQIDVPPCGHYYGWTQLPAAKGTTDQVVVAVPFDPTCGSTTPQSQTVDQVVPLGAGQGLAGHAPVGPIQALQALPGD